MAIILPSNNRHLKRAHAKAAKQARPKVKDPSLTTITQDPPSASQDAVDTPQLSSSLEAPEATLVDPDLEPEEPLTTVETEVYEPADERPDTAMSHAFAEAMRRSKHSLVLTAT